MPKVERTPLFETASWALFNDVEHFTLERVADGAWIDLPPEDGHKLRIRLILINRLLARASEAELLKAVDNELGKFADRFRGLTGNQFFLVRFPDGGSMGFPVECLGKVSKLLTRVPEAEAGIYRPREGVTFSDIWDAAMPGAADNSTEH